MQSGISVDLNGNASYWCIVIQPNAEKNDTKTMTTNTNIAYFLPLNFLAKTNDKNIERSIPVPKSIINNHYLIPHFRTPENHLSHLGRARISVRS